MSGNAGKLARASSEERGASTSPRPLEEDLHWCAARLARGLGVAEEHVVQQHRMSLRGYVVLTAIAQQPESSQLDIARLSALDKTVLVGLVDELESAGFVIRTPDPSDRRAKLLSLTGSGRKALAGASADVRAIENALLENLTAAQRDIFAKALQALGSGDMAISFDTRPCN